GCWRRVVGAYVALLSGLARRYRILFVEKPAEGGVLGEELPRSRRPPLRSTRPASCPRDRPRWSEGRVHSRSTLRVAEYLVALPGARRVSEPVEAHANPDDRVLIALGIVSAVLAARRAKPRKQRGDLVAAEAAHRIATSSDL